MKNADANADGKLQTQEFVNWVFSSKGGGVYSKGDKEQMINDAIADFEG